MMTNLDPSTDPTPVRLLGDALAVCVRLMMAREASVSDLFLAFENFLAERVPDVFPRGNFSARGFRDLRVLYERSRGDLHIPAGRDPSASAIGRAAEARRERGDLSHMEALAEDMRRAITDYLSMRFDQARRCYHCGPKQLHVRIQPRRVVIAGIVDPVQGAIQGACGEPPPRPLGPPDNYVFLSPSTPTPL